MKNVRVVYRGGNLYDPLAVCSTVGVKAEIDGKEYGNYVEIDYRARPEEVCSAIQGSLNMLQEIEEGCSAIQGLLNMLQETEEEVKDERIV